MHGQPVLAPIDLTPPTDQALLGDTSATAFSTSSMCSVSGLGTTVQAAPFQRSVSVPVPKSSRPEPTVPTAQASDAEPALTPFSMLFPAPALGLGTTENAAFAGPAAKRPTALSASAVLTTARTAM